MGQINRNQCVSTRFWQNYAKKNIIFHGDFNVNISPIANTNTTSERKCKKKFSTHNMYPLINTQMSHILNNWNDKNALFYNHHNSY